MIYWYTWNFNLLFSAVATNLFLIKVGREGAGGRGEGGGGGCLFVILSYKYNKSRKAEKYISYACFWLQVHCIVYWIHLFFLLKMAKIKAIKEEIQNNTKVLTNKYSLFGRTLPISKTMLQWIHESYKTFWSQNLLETKSSWITI